MQIISKRIVLSFFFFFEQYVPDRSEFMIPLRPVCDRSPVEASLVEALPAVRC